LIAQKLLWMDVLVFGRNRLDLGSEISDVDALVSRLTTNHLADASDRSQYPPAHVSTNWRTLNDCQDVGEGFGRGSHERWLHAIAPEPILSRAIIRAPWSTANEAMKWSIRLPY